MYITIEYTENIATILLNRERTNSLDHKLLIELDGELESLLQNEVITVIIIKSAVPFGFSSGLDLGSFYIEDSLDETASNIRKAVQLVYSISQRILTSSKLFIAAVSGPVIGSALSLILSCDFRIASKNTWLWSPDPQYGGILADGAVELTRELVGTSRSFILHMTNERVTAQTAYDWGLFYKITETEKLEEVVAAFSKKLASYSPYSLGQTKKMINRNITIPDPVCQLSGLFNNDAAFTFLTPYLKHKK